MVKVIHGIRGGDAALANMTIETFCMRSSYGGGLYHDGHGVVRDYVSGRGDFLATVVLSKVTCKMCMIRIGGAQGKG